MSSEAQTFQNTRNLLTDCVNPQAYQEAKLRSQVSGLDNANAVKTIEIEAQPLGAMQNNSEIEREILMLKETVGRLSVNYEKAVNEIVLLRKENENFLRESVSKSFSENAKSEVAEEKQANNDVLAQPQIASCGARILISERICDARNCEEQPQIASCGAPILISERICDARNCEEQPQIASCGAPILISERICDARNYEEQPQIASCGVYPVYETKICIAKTENGEDMQMKVCSGKNEKVPTKNIEGVEVLSEPKICAIRHRRLSEAELEVKTKSELLESKTAQISLLEKELSLIKTELEEKNTRIEELTDKLERVTMSLECAEEREANLLEERRILEEERAEEIKKQNAQENKNPSGDFQLEQQDIDNGVVTGDFNEFETKYFALKDNFEQQSVKIQELEAALKSETDKLAVLADTKLKVQTLESRVQELESRVHTETEKAGGLVVEKSVLQKQVEELRTKLSSYEAKAATTTSATAKIDSSQTYYSIGSNSNSNLNSISYNYLSTPNANANPVISTTTTNDVNSRRNEELNRSYNAAMAKFSGNASNIANNQTSTQGQIVSSGTSYLNATNAVPSSSSTYTPSASYNYNSSSVANAGTPYYTGLITNTTGVSGPYYSSSTTNNYSDAQNIVSSGNPIGLPGISGISGSSSTLMQSFGKALIDRAASNSGIKYSSRTETNQNYGINGTKSIPKYEYSNSTNTGSSTNIGASSFSSRQTPNYVNGTQYTSNQGQSTSNNPTYFTGLIDQGHPYYVSSTPNPNATASSSTNVYSGTNYLSDYGTKSYTNAGAKNEYATGSLLVSSSNTNVQRKVETEADDSVARLMKQSNASINTTSVNYGNYPGTTYTGQTTVTNTDITNNKSNYEFVSGGNTYRPSVLDGQIQYQSNPTGMFYKQY